MFDVFRSSWPTAEAVVIRTAFQRVSKVWWQRGSGFPPAVLYVWFEYKAEGVKYSDVFSASAQPSDRRLEHEVVGEKLVIRYNPRKHSDALPVESYWHDLKVWWPGQVFNS